MRRRNKTGFLRRLARMLRLPFSIACLRRLVLVLALAGGAAGAFAQTPQPSETQEQLASEIKQLTEQLGENRKQMEQAE